MARKNTLLTYKIISAAALGTASTTSAVTGIQFMDNIAMQFIWSAGSTPIGTIAIQVSLDYAQDSQGVVTNSGTWTALTISPSLAISGNSGSLYVDLNQLGAPWVRAVYTKTSGTGTLNAYIAGKEI